MVENDKTITHVSKEEIYNGIDFVVRYQAGWFTLARRQPRNENGQQEQQADPAQENIVPENPQPQEVNISSSSLSISNYLSITAGRYHTFKRSN